MSISVSVRIATDNRSNFNAEAKGSPSSLGRDETSTMTNMGPFESYPLPLSASLLPPLVPPQRERGWSMRSSSFDAPSYRHERSLSMAAIPPSMVGRAREALGGTTTTVSWRKSAPPDAAASRQDEFFANTAAQESGMLSPAEARRKLRKLEHGSFHRPRLTSDTGSW